MLQNDQLVTTTRAARELRVSPRTLLRWLCAGQVPGIQTPGGHWRIALADLEAAVAGKQRGRAAARRTGGPRMVVVEDDVQHAEALIRLLRLLTPTAAVQHAADGLSAGLLLGTVKPDVAFIDIELPRLDGIELIRRALLLPAVRQVVFVVVSGKLSPQRIAELMQLGVRHILPKPVQPEQLKRVLGRVLGHTAEKRSTLQRQHEATYG